MYLALRRFLPLSLNYLLLGLGALFFFVIVINLGTVKLIEGLNFFHDVFKTSGGSWLFNFILLSYFISLLLLGLLGSI
jgi:hypothetical protein